MTCLTLPATGLAGGISKVIPEAATEMMGADETTGHGHFHNRRITLQ